MIKLLFAPTTWPSFFLNSLLVILLFAPLVLLIFATQTYHWEVITNYRRVFFQGWLITIIISLVSFLLSCTIGILVALAKRSRLLLLRYLSTLYIEFIRGTPLLVQILFFFYVVASAIGIENRFIVGVIILSCYCGAYLAEIFRAGIESISKSQLESAKAIGFTSTQTYRFVIFPQALRVSLPPLTGQFASLIKDSSLLSLIGINEFTFAAQQVNSSTYSTLESFIPLGIGYLLLTFPISLWSRYLEKRYLYET